MTIETMKWEQSGRRVKWGDEMWKQARQKTSIFAPLSWQGGQPCKTTMDNRVAVL